MCNFVRLIGLEPTRLAAPDPKSGVSTNSTTSAHLPLCDIQISFFDDAKVHILAELTNYFNEKVKTNVDFFIHCRFTPTKACNKQLPPPA